MIRNALNGIEGVGMYPVISLIVFFMFFVGTVIWTFRKSKEYTRKMAELPLKDHDKG